MADEDNNCDFVCVDTATSSTDVCITPSTTMSEEIPIREKRDESLKTKDDSPGSDHDEAKEIKLSDNHAHHIEHHPIPFEIYIIRARKEPRHILGLSMGELRMKKQVLPSGFLWICVPHGNWCGFRNINSGTYLGHDGAGKMAATNTNCEEEEYFVPIRQEGGGYILHTFHPEERELLQVAEDDNGVSLVEKKEGGTAFDFINAEYMNCCVSLALPNMEEEILFKQPE